MPAFYRDGWIDALTGLPLTTAAMVAERDLFLSQISTELSALADELGEPESAYGAIPLDPDTDEDGLPILPLAWTVAGANRWEDAFTDKVNEVNVRAATLVAGGSLYGITTQGWETIAGVLDRQSPYVAGFINEVRVGVADTFLSKAGIASRSELYAGSATETWSRVLAMNRAPGLRLPEHPGAQQCGGRCRCRWQIEETETEWVCTWRASGDENSCAGCRSNASEFAPFVFPKEVTT